jgi:hypothetical protein
MGLWKGEEGGGGEEEVDPLLHRGARIMEWKTKRYPFNDIPGGGYPFDDYIFPGGTILICQAYRVKDAWTNGV